MTQRPPQRPFIPMNRDELVQFGHAQSAAYQQAEPFPHAVFHDFFDLELLDEVRARAPSLADATEFVESYDNKNERKLASVGERQFKGITIDFARYLNSEPFLKFIEALTGIEHLVPDPHFWGAGHHEILPGGYLKVHADFNHQKDTRLDRRINVIIYLNKDWKAEYGAALELWDAAMTASQKSILPCFNTMVVFSTTSWAYHGHPNPVRCPQGQSRKSFALYYYTNGRPADERHTGHSTQWQARPGTNDDDPLMKRLTKKAFATSKHVFEELSPPIFFRAVRALYRFARGRPIA